MYLFICAKGLYNEKLECVKPLTMAFGGDIYSGRLYYNDLNAIYSVSLQDLTEPARVEIANLNNNGIHHIKIHMDCIYIQDTYLQRILKYSLVDGIADLSTKTVIEPFPYGINGNLLVGNMVSDHMLTTKGQGDYRHFNSMFFKENPLRILGTSAYLRNAIINKNPSTIRRDSTIDIIYLQSELQPLMLESYQVPEFAIHDLTEYNGFLYFLTKTSLCKYDLTNKQYLGPVYTYPHVSNPDDYMGRGLSMRDDVIIFGIMPVVSRRPQFGVPVDADKSVTKLLTLDTRTLELIKVQTIEQGALCSVIHYSV